MKPDLIWAVLSKVIQSNARFGLTDRLEVYLDHVKIPVGNGKLAEKTTGRSLDVPSGIKQSIVSVNSAYLCLTHALIIVIAQVNVDPKHALYRLGKCIKNMLIFLRLLAWIYLPEEALKNFNSFNSTFRNPKLCLMD